MDGMSSGAVSARLALGVTTVALVALASAGTAVVVSTGRSGVNLGSLPPQLSLPLGVSRSGAIVVGAPPGRAWPSDVHPVQRSGTAGPITVGPFQQVLSGPAIRGVVSTSFTDGPLPLPAPFVSTAPAAPGPVDNPPSQTPVGDPVLGPPVDSPQSQRPPIPPPPSLLCRPVLLELPLPPELPPDRCLPSSTPDGLLDRVLDDDGPGEGLLSEDGSPVARSDDSGDSKAPGIRTPLLLSLLRDGNLELPDCSDSARLLCASLIGSPAFGVMLFRQMGQVSCSDSQAVTH